MSSQSHLDGLVRTTPALDSLRTATTDQRQQLLLRLAIECRRRPHLHRLLLRLCQGHESDGLHLLSHHHQEPTMLLALDAAAALLGAAPRAARRTLRSGELLPLLLHSSPSVRAASAGVVGHLVRMPDASRASLLGRWHPSPPHSASADAVPLGTAAIDKLAGAATVASAALHVMDEYQAVSSSSSSSSSSLSSCSSNRSSSPAVASSAGRLALPHGESSSGGGGEEYRRLVSIPHSEAALSRLSLALACSRPLLLSGAAGCGKSALVEELAFRLGQRDGLVRVHMDEQIDSKVESRTRRRRRCASSRRACSPRSALAV